MSEITTDIKNLELETLNNLKRSKAQNTLRAYQADFKDFKLFCIKNGLAALPTAVSYTHLTLPTNLCV